MYDWSQLNGAPKEQIIEQKNNLFKVFTIFLVILNGTFTALKT